MSISRSVWILFLIRMVITGFTHTFSYRTDSLSSGHTTALIRITKQYFIFFRVHLATRGHYWGTLGGFDLFFCHFFTRAGVKPGLLGWKLPLYHPDSFIERHMRMLLRVKVITAQKPLKICSYSISGIYTLVPHPAYATSYYSTHCCTPTLSTIALWDRC